ncbi:unnamed protein product, partial [Amoebophrya sp. A25]|eukprot:GSA25T00009966001.1
MPATTTFTDHNGNTTILQLPATFGPGGTVHYHLGGASVNGIQGTATISVPGAAPL